MGRPALVFAGPAAIVLESGAESCPVADLTAASIDIDFHYRVLRIGSLEGFYYIENGLPPKVPMDMEQP
jgi:hypothetical protein